MIIPRLATSPPWVECGTSLHIALAEDGDGSAEVGVGAEYDEETVEEDICVEGVSVDTVVSREERYNKNRRGRRKVEVERGTHQLMLAKS